MSVNVRDNHRCEDLCNIPNGALTSLVVNWVNRARVLFGARRCVKITLRLTYGSRKGKVIHMRVFKEHLAHRGTFN